MARPFGPEPRNERHELPVRWDIRPLALLKLAVAALLAFALIKLAPLILLCLMSLLLAVTFSPLVGWLERRGLPQWAGVLAIAAGLLGGMVLLVALVVPTLVEQIGVLIQGLPQTRADILAQTPPALRGSVNHLFSNPGVSGASAISGHLITVGGLAIGGISEIGLLLIISLYLLVDGRRAYEWLLAFFAPPVRMKLHQTSREVSEVVFAYVVGQLITSALVTAYAFTVLSLLHVPAPLILAMLAGLFDILPIIGFFLSTGPAALLALTVSPMTAFTVVLLYLAYHAIENYLIVPKVYGNRLRLSTLAVLLALLVGGILAGIPGAILVLPLVASYPIVEKIWLGPYLGERVVERHEEQLEDTA